MSQTIGDTQEDTFQIKRALKILLHCLVSLSTGSPLQKSHLGEKVNQDEEELDALGTFGMSLICGGAVVFFVVFPPSFFVWVLKQDLDRPKCLN